jgi:cysteine desulfurase/selenocysteine lyase
MNISEFAKAFPEKSEWVHLNNAGLALPTKPAVQTIQNWLTRFQNEGAHGAPNFLNEIEITRKSLAKLLGCKASEVAFFQSTSGAVSQLAFGIELKSDDEIITWDQEYPSNSLPWKIAAERTGAKLVTVASGKDLSTPVESLLNAITAKTKVVAISWVQYQTGAMTDLKKLTAETKARGIWTVVDGIQGFGQLPFDFADSGVDVVCGGSHKWLLSFVGVGFLAIREERLAEVKPLMIGTETFQISTEPSLMYTKEKQEAAKFEPGSKQFLEIAALGASIDLILQVGVEEIENVIHQRAQRLRNGLRQLGFEVHCPHQGSPRGSIVNFSKGNANERVRLEALLKQNRIGFVHRAPGIRFSPHVYNSEKEIDHVLSVLEGK